MKSFKFLFVFAALFLFSARSQAIDSIYLGAQLGHVGLGGNAGSKFSNAIGFGLDLGIRTNPTLDVIFHLQTSSHSNNGGLNLYSQFISADWHLFEFNDFDFFATGGPGFYFFKDSVVTNSNFGLNLGAGVDIIIDEALRLGINGRYHSIFSATNGGSYFTFMMKFGYLFNLN